MKEFKIQELRKEEDFDLRTLCADVPFTQARFYGEWQKTLGRRVRRFLILDDGDVVAYYQVIRYPLLFDKNYLYIPYGPILKETSGDFFIFLRQELKKLAQEENAVFVRLDSTPPPPREVLARFFTKAPSSTYHSAYFQPRTEWFLDLHPTEEELLAGMHDKNRYSIRTAEKREIHAEIITEGFEKYFDVFYRLMKETAARDGFHLHPKKYYETVFQSLVHTRSYLAIAQYGEQILAIGVIIIFGKTANYVFGASSDAERNRMPTYLSQWKAMCYAKQAGCEAYNFGAVSGGHDTHTSWEGLTRFKKRFGGREVAHADFFDVVASPLWYYLYTLRKWLKNLRA